MLTRVLNYKRISVTQLISALSTVNFNAKGISQVIHDFHDNISRRMLKIRGDTISNPLEIMFKQGLLTGTFPSEWKKVNIVPIDKKYDKQNHCLLSLLRICGKTFERLFSLANNLITANQPGFQPDNSGIHQLLSNTHKIYSPFKDGLEVLDVYQTYLKVLTKFGKKS